jgi:hypothetical protein
MSAVRQPGGIKIFISYRRQDSMHQTGRIYDRLEARFGAEAVFKDVDSIPLGVDFRTVLANEVPRCDVVLVVIGDQWLNVVDAAGKRRLDDPGDFVRIEIELALARGVPVIPLLVGKAGMPSDQQLPPSLKPLAFRNATVIRPDPDFRRDMDRLIAVLEKTEASQITASPEPPPPLPVPSPSRPKIGMPNLPPGRESVGTAVSVAVLEGYDASLRESASGGGVFSVAKNFLKAAVEVAMADLNPRSVCAVAFSHDGKFLAAGVANKTARLWSLPDGKPVATLQGHTGCVNGVAFSPTGRLLATVSDDKSIRLWGLQDRNCLSVIQGHTDRILGVAFSPEGQLFASCGWDKTARLYGLTHNKWVTVLQGHGDIVRSVAFHPNGKMLATGCLDSKARLFSVPDGQCLTTLSGHTGRVICVQFSPDGQWLFTAGSDHTARMWNVHTGQCVFTMKHPEWVWSLAISADGTLLATVCDDKVVRLWSLIEKKNVAAMSDHTRATRSVAFRPQSRWLASGGYDGFVRVWQPMVRSELCDWSCPKPALPPVVRVQVHKAPGGVLHVGDHLWLHVIAENTGRGEAVRLLAEVQSSFRPLNGLQAAFGLIKPGEKVERCLALDLQPEVDVNVITGQLTFQEGNGNAPQPVPFQFEIRPLPRPDFPISLRLVNDGSGSSQGTGDGQPKRGESIDIVVAIRNQIGEDLTNVTVKFRALQSAGGVRAPDQQHSLAALLDGGSAQVSFGFFVEKTARTGPARFEVRVESGDGRTFAVQTIDTMIS